MGTSAKVANIVFRVLALISAAIVAGIVGHGIVLIKNAGGGMDSRIIYTEALAGISIFFALLLTPPFIHAFWAFPLDFAIFVMWIVCFGLLVNVSGGHACSASWEYNYNYYWGFFWRTYPVDVDPSSVVNSTGCAEWRSTLAFIFLGGLCWLVNSCIGVIATFASKERVGGRSRRNASTV